MTAYGLTTEHLVNPLGLDAQRPRLSWKCRGGREQKAYCLQAAADEDQLAGGVLIWDSGTVEDSESLNVEFPVPLDSCSRIFWRVQLLDETGEWGCWSETASFEMGLLSEADRCAQWINPEESYEIDSEPPASLLRREFTVRPGFLSARLYVSALGMYEGFLNGSRVGDQVLTPGFTHMQARRQYQTYDVTALLAPGQNAVGFMLGDGWARSRLGFGGQRNQFSTEIALWALLSVAYPDGRETAVMTDLGWKTTKEGPVRQTDLRDGEIYDARLEKPGWANVGFDDSRWLPVHPHAYEGSLEGTSGVPVREVRRVTGKLLPTPDGRTVVDFGENLAGYVEFTVSGRAGDEVRLVHGEVLDKAGNFTMRNFHFGDGPSSFLVDARQEITYILAGNGPETFKPGFAFMGFRYVLVDKWPGVFDPSALTAIVVSSDMDRTGFFSCSDEMLNRLYANAVRSQVSNFIDIPTDCPHRERMGWTGDAQIFCRTASTNFDTEAFFTKWLRDIRAAQTPQGQIPNTVPNPSMLVSKLPPSERACSSGWGDAISIIPLKLYEVYADKRILRDNYDAMKRWVDYEAASAASHLDDPEDPLSQYIWDSGFHWGEWLEPFETFDKQPEYWKKPKDEVATAYFAHSAELLSQAAAILGYEEDAEKYALLSAHIREAYLCRFTENGVVNGGTRQCLYVRPLAFGLLPPDGARKTAERLAEIAAENDYHIGTGFLSTSYLCEVLSDNGHTDTAYKMLQTKTCPSWLYPITRGATTIWESWDGYDRDGEPFGSHNHYSFGSVTEWFYRRMVGIDTDIREPGYKRILFRPTPGGGITRACAAIETVRGRVTCGWQLENGSFTLELEIPSNTRAAVLLPDFISSIREPCGISFTRNGSRFEAEISCGNYRIIAN